MAVTLSPHLTVFYEGSIADSATIDVYQSGTTTRVTTYSNGTYLATNTNPIVCNSNGEATIYVNTSTALRMVFKTSGGATIRDLDPIYINPDLSGLTASVAELNILDGATLSTAELNILDGVTATAAELNTLDGITASTAELNTMDGVTASTADLNLTTTYLNGVTPGTVTASKALIVDASSKLNVLNVDNITIDSNTISSTNSNGNINLTPNGTGKVVLSGINYPTADGTANQTLKTDGAGNLSFASSSSGFLLNQFYPSF